MIKLINKKHKKYMIIDARRFRNVGEFMYHNVNNDFRLAFLNDFKGNANEVDNLFARNGIPKEYRKIIINLTSKEKFYTNNIYGEEFLTKIPFIIKREYTNDDITYRGTQKSFKYGLVGCAFYDYANYSKKLGCANGNLFDVVKFFRDLRDKGLLKNYVTCLMEVLSLVRFDCNCLYNDEIFDQNFNLDYAFDIMAKKKRMRK